MVNQENISYQDNKGSYHCIILKYYPHLGFTTIHYGHTIINDVNLYKLNKPLGDNELEWERYELAFDEWKDETKVNVNIILSEYFNNG